jgi:hypothetical protein
MMLPPLARSRSGPELEERSIKPSQVQAAARPPDLHAKNIKPYMFELEATVGQLQADLLLASRPTIDVPSRVLLVSNKKAQTVD